MKKDIDKQTVCPQENGFEKRSKINHETPSLTRHGKIGDLTSVVTPLPVLFDGVFSDFS